MKFPETEQELIAQGYVRKRINNCNGPTCSARIEWWKTPNGRLIPLDVGTLKPHWSTCKDAEYFRSRK